MWVNLFSDALRSEVESMFQLCRLVLFKHFALSQQHHKRFFPFLCAVSLIKCWGQWHTPFDVGRPGKILLQKLSNFLTSLWFKNLGFALESIYFEFGSAYVIDPHRPMKLKDHCKIREESDVVEDSPTASELTWYRYTVEFKNHRFSRYWWLEEKQNTFITMPGRNYSSFRISSIVLEKY